MPNLTAQRLPEILLRVKLARVLERFGAEEV